MKLSHILLIALLLLFIFAFPRKDRVVIETVTYRDTIRDTVPKLVTKYVTRYDTIILSDTQYLYLPISRYEFRDTNYRIVVDGYNVKPLLIETYEVTNIVTNKRKERRISFSPVVGFGVVYGTKGLDIGLIAGVGLKLNF